MLLNPFKYRTCRVTWQDDEVMIRSYRKDHITRSLKRGNYYEGEFLELIAQKYATSGLFVDVGAFVGNHSVFFARNCGADHVVSFEPFPETFELLDHNIRRNNLGDNVTCVNKAVSDEHGTLTMAVVSKRNRGMNRIDSAGTTSVEVTTLDDELGESALPITFLKIDAEGHGSNVLRGAKNIIEKFKPVIAIEVDPEPLDLISSILIEHDYVAKSCHNATPTWIFEHASHDQH